MFECSPESANTMSFSSASEFSRPSRAPISTVSVKQGAVRLEIAYEYETRELRLNGIPVDLPEGHDIVLVDDVDEAPVSSTRSASGARRLSGSRCSSVAQTGFSSS